MAGRPDAVVRRDAWAFYSWQNIATAFALVGWAVWIARRQGRTPLEAVMPRLDLQLVAYLRPRAAARPPAVDS